MSLRPVILLVAIAALFSTAFVSTVAAQESSAAQAVRSAHDSLFVYLGDDANAQAWRRYLMSKDLDEQLKLGAKADRKVLKTIAAKYAAQHSGLQMYQFTQVRDALAAWQADLARPTVETLSEKTREAKADFRAVTDAELTSAKSATRQAMETLDYFLEPKSGWRSYLQFDDLKTQLKADKPDLDSLTQVHQRFARDYRGLEMTQFSAVRDALAKYLPLLRIAQDPQAEANYQARLETLATGLAAYRDGRKVSDLQQAAQAMRWLEDRGQAAEIIKVARSAYWKPNMILEMSPELVTHGFRSSVDENENISETSNGNPVSGTARTTGQTQAKLMPHRSLGVIYNEFHGTTVGRTTTSSPQATVYSRATTATHAIKQISLDRLGFKDYPTTVAADTQSVTEGIDSAYPDQVRQRVEAVRSERNAAASRRIEDRTRQRMDRESREQLQEANDNFYRRYIQPFTKYDAYPSDLQFTTTSEALRVAGTQSLREALAATDDPPAAPSGKAISTRIHQSWVNNTAQAMYGGRTVPEEEFRKELSDIFGRTPDRLQRKNKNPPWTIGFAAQSPFSVRFAENAVLLSMRGLSYKSGKSRAQEIPMNVTAVYQIAKDAQGPKYVRQGDLQVFPPEIVAKFDKDGDGWLNADEEKALTPETASLTGAQSSLRGQLQDDFASVLSAEIRPEPQTLTGRWASLGQLKMDELSAKPGWLVSGYVIDKNPPKKAATSK